MMTKEEYYEMLRSVVRSMEQAEYHSSEVEGLGTISSDEGDIGNEIGIAVGEHIVKLGLDKHNFISGIKHGISLKDGTHG